ncbi:transcriptional repressor NrdR [bacterium]|nr:transcriptional repressor NrdR [bacterium]
MRCPFCAHDEDKVVDSRSREDGRVVRRRRLCLACGQRFSTIEEIEDKTLYVIKSDNRREEYDRNKLMRGLKIACSKRPVSIERLEQLATEIEISIQAEFVKEVRSRKIGEMVSRRLREIDEVAYVRFASVYRNFKDKDEFLKELNELKTN